MLLKTCYEIRDQKLYVLEGDIIFPYYKTYRTA